MLPNTNLPLHYCVFLVLTFEELDLEGSFVICRYVFRTIRSSLSLKFKLKVTGTKGDI